jgi:hypothetical protein
VITARRVLVVKPRRQKSNGTRAVVADGLSIHPHR